jgi:hypothetical protein
LKNPTDPGLLRGDFPVRGCSSSRTPQNIEELSRGNPSHKPALCYIPHQHAESFEGRFRGLAVGVTLIHNSATCAAGLASLPCCLPQSGPLMNSSCLARRPSDHQSMDPDIYQIHTKAAGPTGKLPVTEDLLLNRPSGDLFGMTMDAGMGWNPAELGRKQFLVLSTLGGVRAPDGTPVALG